MKVFFLFLSVNTSIAIPLYSVCVNVNNPRYQNQFLQFFIIVDNELLHYRVSVAGFQLFVSVTSLTHLWILKQKDDMLNASRF